MPIRLARYSDLGPISRICAASFYDEELNDWIFPLRKQYPDDYVRVWREKVVKNWWNYNRIWIVNYENSPEEKSGEIITGVAEWGKDGKDSDRLWGVVRWWDPSEFVCFGYRFPFQRPFCSFHSFQPSIWERLNPAERTKRRMAAGELFSCISTNLSAIAK